MLPDHKIQASFRAERASKIEGLLLAADLLHEAVQVLVLGAQELALEHGPKKFDLLDIVGLFGGRQPGF